ncbi:MAG: hypothetical protein WB562_13560, partial [Candidatus Sulfotelmatobacter sp.]
MRCLYICNQNLSDFRIATLFSEDLVNSFQRGNVIGTIFKIENFDLHFLSNLPFVAAERAFSQAGNHSNTENYTQKYA